jgi:segregation and condensation protein A
MSSDSPRSDDGGGGGEGGGFSSAQVQDEDSKRRLSRPPLNLLLNPEGNRISKPWEIDLERLLTMFLDLITKSEFLDLRLCGSAALSSALIYRLKVETLFLLDKIRASRMQRIDISGEVPLILDMPFRQEVYSTSIEDLISTLEAILEDIIRGKRKQQERTNLLALEPATAFEPDKFLNKIAELVNEFRIKVLSELRKYSSLLFSQFTEGKDALERAQYFIFLLFLAMEGTVLLEQTADGNDILISGIPVTTV